MIARFAYDASFDPPAPMVPVRISAPAGEDAVMLPMLVDTGADCTLVPASIVRRLGLPQIDVIGLTGVGGARQRATVHAAAVEFGGVRLLARIVAFVDEAILGRDVLNQAILRLDGPGLALSLGGRSRTRRRQRAT
ncbi:MAG TPA: aspartyl protease family protein [Kofleriaceae bacterium]|jgi:predicted aspartyl protease|nr:aspartyl protease family protein [Kofleriaceae bacterium]